MHTQANTHNSMATDKRDELGRRRLTMIYLFECHWAVCSMHTHFNSIDQQNINIRWNTFIPKRFACICYCCLFFLSSLDHIQSHSVFVHVQCKVNKTTDASLWNWNTDTQLFFLSKKMTLIRRISYAMQNNFKAFKIKIGCYHSFS